MDYNFDIIERILPNDLFGKELYHYTSAIGLKGIIEQKKLWCSQIFYLNDIEENLNGWKVFFESLKDFKKDNRIDEFKKIVSDEFKHWDNLNYDNITNEDFKKLNISDYNTYLFSLSLVEDDLGQWRSYTPDSLGFNICFNFNQQFIKLQTRHFDNTFTEKGNIYNCKILLRQCIYDDTIKKQKFTELLNHYYDDFLSNKKDWIDDLFFNILTLCLFIKNEKFESEKECRIVVLPMQSILKINGKPENLIHLRPGKSFLIPYIELDSVYECVKRITIGPTPHPIHSIESIKIMLENLKEKGELKSEIELKLTKVPYRTW